MFNCYSVSTFRMDLTNIKLDAFFGIRDCCRSRCRVHASTMGGVRTFLLCSNGEMNSNDRYAFPYEELADGIIDMTEEQKPFYFNPYSGELSLIYPRAERKCRGGILACVVVVIYEQSLLINVVPVTVRSFRF